VDVHVDLREHLDRLKELAPIERGLGLEALVARLFRLAAFEVRRNPGAARPRQTDLYAFSDRYHYLVEVKWQAQPLTVSDLDALWSRLGRGPSDVVGVLISLGGFSATVLEQVAAHRQRSVILIGPGEFSDLVDGLQGLRTVLDDKLQALRVEGVVELPDHEIHAQAVRPRRPRERAPQIVLSDGTRPAWIAAGGSFGAYTFAVSVNDPSWGPGPATSVVLDMSLAVDSQDELLAVFDRLDELGRTTTEGQWSIQQSRDNWHGVGAGGLREALLSWEVRYMGASELHYREEGCYTDRYDEGFYTVTFDVSADHHRRVWNAELSLELPGVPLDRQPVDALCRAIAQPQPLHFRVRAAPVFASCSMRGMGLDGLEPVASIVVEDPQPEGEKLWVTAVAVPNPLRGRTDLDLPEDLPSPLLESAVLLCDIGHWHLLGQGPEAYRLVSAEWASTSDGVIVHVRADWDDDTDGGGAEVAPART
jgi:hypothetical protein